MSKGTNKGKEPGVKTTDQATRSGGSWTATMLAKHGKSPHVRHEEDED